MSKRLITSLNNVYDCKFSTRCNKKYSDTYIKSIMTQLKKNLDKLDEPNKKKANRLLKGSQKTETKKETKKQPKKKVDKKFPQKNSEVKRTEAQIKKHKRLYNELEKLGVRKDVINNLNDKNSIITNYSKKGNKVDIEYMFKDTDIIQPHILGTKFKIDKDKNPETEPLEDIADIKYSMKYKPALNTMKIKPRKKTKKTPKLPKGKGKVQNVPTPPMSKNIIKEETLLIKDKPKTKKRGRPRRELGTTKKATKEKQPQKTPKSIQVKNVPISQLKSARPARGLKGLAERKPKATIEEVNKLIDNNINMVERLKKNLTMKQVEKEFLKELLKKVNSRKNYTKEEKVKLMNMVKKKAKAKVKEAFDSLPSFLDEL